MRRAAAAAGAALDSIALESPWVAWQISAKVKMQKFIEDSRLLHLKRSRHR
jgi:hypothetical protein